MAGDDGAAPQLLHVVGEQRPTPGDLVTTSGDGEVLPRGLLIGRVAAPDARAEAEGRPLRVTLAADLDELDFVRILRRSSELEAPGPAALVTRPAAQGFAAPAAAAEDSPQPAAEDAAPPAGEATPSDRGAGDAG